MSDGLVLVRDTPDHAPRDGENTVITRGHFFIFPRHRDMAPARIKLPQEDHRGVCGLIIPVDQLFRCNGHHA
jgi:hypothetical protein